MTEKQYAVERSKLDVLEAESRVREAHIAMNEGYRKLESRVIEAKAEQEREYGKLKEEWERAKLNLAKEKAYLEKAQSDAEKGFES